MSHFGVVAPAFFSHFQALQALAGELLDRGHTVTFFHQADARRWLVDPRIAFHAVGAITHPPGSLAGSLQRAANSSNPLGLRRVIRDLCDTTQMFCTELPGALARQGVDALICDQMEAGGGLVAEALGLPFISVACALPVNREKGLPLPVMPFALRNDERSLRIYQGSQQVHDWFMRPLSKVLHAASHRLGVEPRDGLHQYLSPLAQISQTIPSFDFPRPAAPEHFHAVGPMRPSSETVAGQWPIDSRKRFIFASLGTLQGSRMSMFKQIAKACHRLEAQLLVAHCAALNTAQEQELKRHGATWVTDFAPQRWALQQADAVITHGGLNTVMDAIESHTPMLVMPIAFDQPGVAARVSYSGAGMQLHRRARASAVFKQLNIVLSQPSEPLRQLAAELQAAGGARRAADIVEAAVRTGQPVPKMVAS